MWWNMWWNMWRILGWLATEEKVIKVVADTDN